MNPVQMFQLARAYGKFQSIEKENTAMNAKIIQIGMLLASLAGAFITPEAAHAWVQAHLGVYSTLVTLAMALHSFLPSIFSGAPSKADQDAAGKVPVAKISALILLALAFTLHASAQDVQNLYAAGLSYSAGASGPQALAGTALYAHAVSPDTAPGMYAFTAVDAVPNSLKPFTVNTNIGVGIAQRVATIKGLAIYAPTAAGVSFNGPNLGWQWNGGVIAAIPVKGYYVIPSVRFEKASIGGDGYKPILGVLFGWGK